MTTRTLKSLALGGVAAAAFVSASMMSNKAEAADLYVAPPPPPPVMTWTGPYIGGFIGGGANNTELSADGDHIDGFGGDGFMFGGFVGYNVQVSPQFVLGIQGDITAPDFDSDLGIFGPSVKFENDIVWSLSARAGWLPADNTMIYVIGGWSNSEFELKADGDKLDRTYNGFHVGGGIETKLTDAITARVEYRYTDYGSKTFVDGLKFEPVSHTGMVGIAYNFGSLF